MSEHPIDLLARALSSDGATSRYFKQHINWTQYHAEHENERAALRAVEQLEPLLRDAGEALRAAHDPERWGDFLSSQVDDLLVRIDAALALFDRKEQEAEPTCPDCGGPFRNGKCHYGHNWPHDRKEQTP